MKKFISLLVSCVVLLGLTACNNGGGSGGSGDDYPVTVADVKIDQKPQSVVSLAPSLTEIVFDLGYGDQLKGVSDYCDTPSSVSDKTRCGTAQAPNLDAIKELAPQVLITSTPLIESDLIQLQQMNVNVVTLSGAQDLDGIYALFGDVARVFAGENTGKKQAEETLAPYKEQLESASKKISDYLEAGNTKSKGIYLRMLDYTMATGDTLEGKLLDMIGIDNLAAGYGEWSYPTDKLEELKPDVLFYNTGVDKDTLLARPAYKDTEAVKNSRVYAVDGTAFERQSLRMFQTVLEMAQQAYPEVFAQADGSSQAEA